MDITINDLMVASSEDVAIAFIAWLATATKRGERMKDSNRRKYAMHLTSEYVSRLRIDQYEGPYNLFELRGCQEVCRVLDILRATDAFKATQRKNGGNGVFQAAFDKLEDFWRHLENGGVILVEEIDPARRQWEMVRNRVANRFQQRR